MACFSEIQGVKTIALYVNADVKFRFPNPVNENEIDLIAHSVGSVVINDQNEMPKWERTVDYSANYKQQYSDTFSFFVHGLRNGVPEIIKAMRNNRKGYVVEIITKDNESLVFPTPVFLDNENTKQDNSHSWTISLSYRVPTFQDYYLKLNTLLMINSFILVGDSQILGAGEGVAIVAN